MATHTFGLLEPYLQGYLYTITSLKVIFYVISRIKKTKTLPLFGRVSNSYVRTSDEVPVNFWKNFTQGVYRFHLVSQGKKCRQFYIFSLILDFSAMEPYLFCKSILSCQIQTHFTMP